MEKKVNSARSSTIARLFLFVCLTVVIVFTACKDSDTHTGGDGDKEFKLSCVVLTQAQVQVWVDSGWTKDSVSGIKSLLLQPYTSNAEGVKSNLSLVAYPGVTYDNVKMGGKSILTPDTTCTGITLTGPVIFSDNTLRLSSLKIFNPDGTLNKFDFIRFIPQKYAQNPEYISYKVEVIRDGKVDESAYGGTQPCPPYCCPPYCD